MDSNQARDDLKAIRQIMARTRKEAAGGGGWFLVLWGLIWLAGFSSSQFATPETVGWIWMVLNGLGFVISIWLGVRLSRRVKSRTSLWVPLALWWVSLLVFAWLLAWLFDLGEGNQLALLIVLCMALGYVQLGLIADVSITVIGALMGALAVGAYLVLPDYFFLAMGVLGGGLLFGSGLWLLRQER